MGSQQQQQRSLAQLLMAAARSDDPVAELEHVVQLDPWGQHAGAVQALLDAEIVMDVVSAIRQSSKTCWACTE